MKKRIVIVAGARPNFIKIAPLIHELKKYDDCFNVTLLHTGQHYDFQMSEVFFQNLNIPSPDIFLDIRSGSHAVQTARIMVAFEEAILKERPDLVVVVGDVNSTLACSIVASKSGVSIAHVEAGLRSFDRAMPEEINRIVTDSLSDYLFVNEESGLKNLEKENVNSDKIYFVGNIMIDTLLRNLPIIGRSEILDKLNLNSREYSVVTLHRPGNVDSSETLSEIFDVLSTISRKIKIIYPLHPRTMKTISDHGFFEKFKNIDGLVMIEPLGYIDFIKLVKDSRFVITDSGGIQEETTVLKIPCLTMRENTERPVTITKGTNYMVGRDRKKIIQLTDVILNNEAKEGTIPELWDGKTGERIVRVLVENL
ncbi:MAG: UDP-N-acetylglucosamine 2-epimerase (non-hydrolyzing) [Candidatus Latescibacteria bacterium]|nr:UDP-N-acetylglucosamine 2-epimerase (non-hydrolyzing) [Candidatus Latescibacterota bacterium]